MNNIRLIHDDPGMAAKLRTCNRALGLGNSPILGARQHNAIAEKVICCNRDSTNSEPLVAIWEYE